MNFNSNIKVNIITSLIFRSHFAYKSCNGSPGVGIQSVPDRQFRIKFPSTGKKQNQSISYNYICPENTVLLLCGTGIGDGACLTNEG